MNKRLKFIILFYAILIPKFSISMVEPYCDSDYEYQRAKAMYDIDICTVLLQIQYVINDQGKTRNKTMSHRLYESFIEKGINYENTKTLFYTCIKTRDSLRKQYGTLPDTAPPLYVAAAFFGDKQLLQEELNTHQFHVGCASRSSHFYGTNPLLHYAIASNNPDVINCLIADGRINAFINRVLYINNQNVTPFFYAIQCGNIEIIKKLLDYSPIITETNNTLYKKLFAVHINNNINTPYNNSPLHEAIKEKNAPVVKLLLTIPTIEVNNILNANGLTPLTFAIINDHDNDKKTLEIIKLMLCHPLIDINNQSTVNKNSPLHVAVVLNRYEIIQLFLNVPDININSLNINEKTPLELASTLEIFNMLKQKGAQKDKKTIIPQSKHIAPSYSPPKQQFHPLLPIIVTGITK